jgi:type II secretory pathway component PulM
MPERIEQALTALRAKLAELESVVRDVSDADWRRATAAEGWPVGLVAFHRSGCAQRVRRVYELDADARR